MPVNTDYDLDDFKNEIRSRYKHKRYTSEESLEFLKSLKRGEFLLKGDMDCFWDLFKTSNDSFKKTNEESSAIEDFQEKILIANRALSKMLVVYGAFERFVDHFDLQVNEYGNDDKSINTILSFMTHYTQHAM